MLERLGLSTEDFAGLEVRCPAGRMLDSGTEGPACRCGVEESLVTAARDPSSLVGYCCGEYVQCPTWRAECAHRLTSVSLVGKMERDIQRAQKAKRGTVLDDPGARSFTI